MNYLSVSQMAKKWNMSERGVRKYCAENNLNPRHDESNDELLYTRNKIRLKVIPYIEENINQNIVNNINRLSRIVVEEEAFIEKEARKYYEEGLIDIEKNKIIFNLKKFNSLDVVLRKRLIKKCIMNVLGNAKDIEEVHINDIVKLCENNVGGKYLTPNKNIKITVIKGRIEYERL